jgi:hypothetical protein
MDIIDMLSSFVHLIASNTILVILDSFFLSIVATLHFRKLQLSYLLQFSIQMVSFKSGARVPHLRFFSISISQMDVELIFAHDTIRVF